ncbi:MAG TPA: colanic acid biosynthesis acetyltransferase WcaF [Flavobacteriales bacterium]|nr:colanic acid biosynthesis acetyltransferase WcaF [Flavobacteriales bacterium]HRE76051.1 WcaF family extracellular polysaccharide biosynthesis acetyltransferase [Flavobacteriales bacterium]HRE97118.1 WcaF family extracellular polysaccharide biosynthesis acetyltransferase [Flavobacteriales bacterium]HRJ36041.1 WcaF family extracellular polysaccharide biosynthesis acetyltransferase [Flavobacteriales bacterium]HRJ38598.1 WcaF family extracellular polysaccharide biosynthesis acetyltransferase [Fl
MKKTTDLSTYSNSWYHPGSAVKRVVWYGVNALFFLNPLFPFSGAKVFFLKLFGAEIGTGVVIKPGVNIKYPWKLKIGDHVWIGEKVWIDNLGQVNIGDHCCLSQGAFLLCGNHDYTKTGFDLIVKDITLENGVWIGAKAIVAPGTVLHSHAVLTAGSMASGELEAYSIYGGNPAQKIRERTIG